MTTPRERGQRFRRKRERAVGKPKIGRPRGSRNVVPTFVEAMKWFAELRKQGHSEMVAGAAIRNQLGETMTDIMVQNARDMGLFDPQRKPKHDLTAYSAVRGKLESKEKTYEVR